MKTASLTPRPGRSFSVVIEILVLALFTAARSAPDELGKTFPTPEAAVKALDQAVSTTNQAGFSELFGPESDWLTNPDER